jgi:hypothetical protein
MPSVLFPSGARKAKPYGGSPPAYPFCRRSMLNGAPQGRVTGGWTHHSHCPRLSHLSGYLVYHIAQFSDDLDCGGHQARAHTGSGNGIPAFRKANLIGAHHVDQRGASSRDHEPGACYCRGTGTVKVRGVLESGKSQTET